MRRIHWLAVAALVIGLGLMAVSAAEAHHETASWERVVLVNLDGKDGIPAASGSEMDAPPLSVTKNELPLETAQELRRRQPNTLIVVGGTDVISNTVIDAARMAADASNVVRCSGSNRHATLADCARFFFPGSRPAAYRTHK